VLALKFPEAGLAVCCCCLVVYLRPEAPGIAEADNVAMAGKRRERRRV
jgi:hypothetical protein